MADTTPKAPYVQHHGAAVVAISYSLVIITIGFAIARFYTTLRRRQAFRFGDWTFLLANCIAFAQAVIVDRAVHNGLGQHFSDLSGSEVNTYFKFAYIAQLLSVAAQGFAKASVVFLIARIDSKKSTKRKCYIIHGLTLTWFIFSMFAIAFQCGLPSPWIFDKNHCAGGDLYYVIIVFNIITDAIIASFFLPVVWGLQMSRPERLTVMSIFACRFLVCGASIGNIVAISRYLNSTDLTWDAVVPTILNEAVMNTSIITAGIPNVHLFLADLQTGQLGTCLAEDQIELSGSNSKAKSFFSYSRSDPNSRNASNNSQGYSRSEESLKLTPPGRGNVQTTISANEHAIGARNNIYNRGKPNREEEFKEDASTSSLRRNVVMQTHEVSVGYEDHDEGNYDGTWGEAK